MLSPSFEVLVVGGGGGGKKIPPGGAKAPATQPKAATTTTGPQKPVASEPQKPPEPELSPKSDSFETFRSFARGTTDVTRLDEAFSHAGSPSGIENLVRMLDATRTQLGLEHRALREQAQTVIERLVQSGFAPAQLERARAELHELRKKMAALRKRLHHLQRRLKSAFASAGKTGDANFAKHLGAQLERLKKLEPGLSRAMLALTTIEQAYGSFADGSPAVLRLHVGDADVGVHARLGDALATIAPGAAIAKATLSLLRDGPEHKPPTEPKHETPAVLDGMRALADALVPTE